MKTIEEIRKYLDSLAKSIEVQEIELKIEYVSGRSYFISIQNPIIKIGERRLRDEE